MSKRVKTFALIVLAIAVAVLVFSMMGGDAPATPSDKSPLSSSGGVSQPLDMQTAESATGEFATMLASIKSISIDDSIFSNPAYKTLRDHPINIGTDTIGRPNPFAPVGTDNVDLSNAPTVQTLQPGKVTSTTAELSAQVSFATTAPVSIVFQYGTTDEYGSVTPTLTFTKSGTAVSVLSGLTPNTKYYVQAVAVVGSTTSVGNVMTFTTTTPPVAR